MAWTLFVLSCLYICEWDIVARHCGQVMNDQQRMEVHSNNLQANPSRSLARGRKFIIQLSEDFFFIFFFYLERYLLWLSIYFPIYKSHSESAFDKCQRGQVGATSVHVWGQNPVADKTKPVNNNRTSCFLGVFLRKIKKSVNLASRAIVRSVLTRGA